MIFWILIAALSAAVTYWVTRPLLRTDVDTLRGATEADIAVYRDQLAEIDADVARGALTAAEAEAARAEVSRRLLRVSGHEVPAGSAAAPATSLKFTHAIATAALPLFSLALYLAFGNPGLPGMPLDERLAAAPEQATAADLVAKVEARLREAPEDGQGWDVIAPVYVSQGRFGEAIEAYANALRLLGETPKRLEGLALADIRAGNGVVSARARKAFERVSELDPKRLEPRMWLALAKEQDQDYPAAIAAYKDLLAQAPQDVPWRSAVAERLAQVEARLAGGATEKPGMAPQTGDGAGGDISAMPAEQRALVDEMVAGLAARLKENGNDLDGWLRLIRSLKVLGREGEAKGALGDARRQFEADAKALSDLDGLAKALALGS